jgi:hypothetical protein
LLVHLLLVSLLLAVVGLGSMSDEKVERRPGKTDDADAGGSGSLLDTTQGPCVLPESADPSSKFIFGLIWKKVEISMMRLPSILIQPLSEVPTDHISHQTMRLVV